MLHSSRRELVPRDFLYATRPPGFQLGQQHDSSEFLGFLLESLNEQEKATLRINKINGVFRVPMTQEVPIVKAQMKNSKSVDSLDRMDIDTVDDENILKEAKPPPHNENCLERTLVNREFGGRMATTYKCLTCNFSNENFDTFRDLHLSFPQETAAHLSRYTIQYLLDCYHNIENLDGDNKYYCDRCKQHNNGERSVNILSAPKTLILTLKYFKYDKKSTSRGKLTHKVELNNTIDLTISNNVTLNYSLYAIVVHSGYSMDGGHYYTYGRDGNTWIKFNDSYVIKSSLKEIENLEPPNTPYILFYELISPSSSNNSSFNANEELNIDNLPCELKEYLYSDEQCYIDELNSHRIAKRHTFI